MNILFAFIIIFALWYGWQLQVKTEKQDDHHKLGKDMDGRAKQSLDRLLSILSTKEQAIIFSFAGDADRISYMQMMLHKATSEDDLLKWSMALSLYKNYVDLIWAAEYAYSKARSLS
jgi:hypothetical protein